MAAYISFQPSDHYKTKLYTGTGASNAITGVGFQPGFTWIKNRDATDFHVLTDTARGVKKYLKSNAITVETTNVESLKTFDADGFTVGTMNEVNTNTEDFVSWNWNLPTTSIPSGGTITPIAAAYNATTGVGVYTYAGNSTASSTIAHGLDAAPNMIIVKSTVSEHNWISTNTAITASNSLQLDNDGAEGGSYYDALPDATYITIGGGSAVNYSSYSYELYAFANIRGFSHFGSYTGNANAEWTFYLHRI